MLQKFSFVKLEFAPHALELLTKFKNFIKRLATTTSLSLAVNRIKDEVMLAVGLKLLAWGRLEFVDRLEKSNHVLQIFVGTVVLRHVF